MGEQEEGVREGKGMGKGKGEGRGMGKGWGMRDVGWGLVGTGPRFETQVDGKVSRMEGFRVEGLSLYLNGCD